MVGVAESTEMAIAFNNNLGLHLNSPANCNCQFAYAHQNGAAQGNSKWIDAPRRTEVETTVEIENVMLATDEPTGKLKSTGK